ncbi:PREDICTED: protein AAR2 homolog [Populus euphratica]|uniref:Protein AAR2 homolog n=1 Tax=Populus euphratica TaxID=75702 RepID=A0AAJ6XJV7_POPEU|nr:PREDICTED: protein AAR2 homolog [Populus euphratica]
MDPETALELVKQGATLLLLDVPQYTIVGIDTQMFSVGPAFKGIKMIPPGPHFVYYSSSSKDGKQFSPIVGFFVDAAPSEVIVRKWNQQEERLVKVPEDEEERFCQAVKSLEFDRYLGPYNLSQYGEWKRLSSYLTKTIIKRIEPIGGEITVACESEMDKNSPKTSIERALDAQLGTGKFSASASVDRSKKRGCYYTTIPRVIKRRGMEGKELTSLNLDKTELLESVLIKDYGGSEDLLLGELQFAYIAFLMGQSLEAFFQWKSLVSLLLSCIDAPFRTRSHLFTKFIKVIFYQLKYGLQKDRKESNGAGIAVSSLLDESWFSADSFLHRLCKDFFLLVQDATVVDGDLLTWTRKLKELLENILGWEFQQNSAVDGSIYFEEDDEFAPVVEMLDESSFNGVPAA